MAGISPRLPLMLDSVDGPYGLITTYKELATQKLKMLLLTNPGERIMNPDFGVGLKSYFFELAGPSKSIPKFHSDRQNRFFSTRG